jgi:acetoin utilization deacetylase AcuC-like enzyme
VAAQRALDEHGAERVLVLDWDVHHGNGTSDIFHSSPEVVYVSIHQWPLYPGTGRPDEFGHGPGLGYTINLPVPPGSGDETFVSLVDHVVAPLAREYRPQLVLVSAGYDAHRDDPLADCAVSEAGYAAMTASVRRECEALGDVPVGLVLEGGYALGALARSVGATLEALCAPQPVVAPSPEVSPLAREGRSRVERFWPGVTAAG